MAFVFTSIKKIRRCFSHDISVKIFSLSFFVFLSSLKMEPYIYSGRIWAEEGLIFYAQISQVGFYEGLFFIFNGHLELATNLVVSIASLFELRYVPLVTTYLSYLLQLIPVILLINYYKVIGLSFISLIIVLLFMVGMPQAAEVWANSVNLHFHFSLIVGIIVIIPIANINNSKYIFRILVFFSGLSGVPANFLMPLFLFIALHTKDKERWVQFYILVSTTLFQVLLILINDVPLELRTFNMNPVVYWAIMLCQNIISPLFGVDIGNQLAAIIKTMLVGNLGGILFSSLLTVLLIMLINSSIFTEKYKHVYLYISVCLLSLCSIALALGDIQRLISASSGGRYFYSANILLLIAILIVIQKKQNILLYIIPIIIAISSVSSVKKFIGGPDWVVKYDEHIQANSDHVEIWPWGWSMPIENNQNNRLGSGTKGDEKKNYFQSAAVVNRANSNIQQYYWTEIPKEKKENGFLWNGGDSLVFKVRVTIIYDKELARKLFISLDSNDSYKVIINGTDTYEIDNSSHKVSNGGLFNHEINFKEIISVEKIEIVAITGDGSYSIGHLNIVL